MLQEVIIMHYIRKILKANSKVRPMNKKASTDYIVKLKICRTKLKIK